MHTYTLNAHTSLTLVNNPRLKACLSSITHTYMQVHIYAHIHTHSMHTLV